MRNLFLALLAVLALPIVADATPRNVMKAIKIRKTLKKLYRKDDTIPIPPYRDVDISKIARSSTYERSFINSGLISKRWSG